MKYYYYFAYGSNMNESRLINRVGRYYNKQKGTLDGYELCFDKPNITKTNSYANIRKSKNSIVEGIVYTLTRKQIEMMNIYEGCPDHYGIHTFDVKINGAEKTCCVYVAKNNLDDDLKPTFHYLSNLLKAKKDLSYDYYLNILKKGGL